MERLLKYKNCVVSFFIVGLAACGGGGSSSTVNPTAGAEATPTITPTVQPTTNVTPTPLATPTPSVTVTPTAMPVSTPSPTPTAEPMPAMENPQTRKTYFFGHSLINWALSEVYHDPTGGTTTVPNWLALMAEAAGNGFSVSGRFGFLRDYNNFGPIPQWGFDDAESAWDDTN